MDTFLSNEFRERISPATEDLQREILDEIKKLESATNDLKFQKVTTTTANTSYTPASHGCKKVRFWTADATVYVDDKNGDIDVKNCLLVQNIWNELPINNVGNLRFLGSAGGEVIYLVSSN